MTNTVPVKRGARAAAPPLPEGQIELAEPPVLGEPAGADFGTALAYLPMGLGMAAMAVGFSLANGSPTTYMMSGMMGMTIVSAAARTDSERMSCVEPASTMTVP